MYRILQIRLFINIINKFNYSGLWQKMIQYIIEFDILCNNEYQCNNNNRIKVLFVLIKFYREFEC